MSINIHIRAKRLVTVTYQIKGVTKSEPKEEALYFDCFQTPSKISNEIMSSENALAAYCDYVLSLNIEDEEDIYDEEDIFGDPIDTIIVNVSKNHVAHLKNWIEECEANGYTIEIEAW